MPHKFNKLLWVKRGASSPAAAAAIQLLLKHTL